MRILDGPPTKPLNTCRKDLRVQILLSLFEWPVRSAAMNLERRMGGLTYSTSRDGMYLYIGRSIPRPLRQPPWQFLLPPGSKLCPLLPFFAGSRMGALFFPDFD